MSCEAAAVMQWGVWSTPSVSWLVRPWEARGWQAYCLHVMVCLPHAQSAACQ